MVKKSFYLRKMVAIVICFAGFLQMDDMKKRNNQRKKRIRLSCLFVTFILCVLLPNSLYAQWSFTATLTYSGKCYVTGYLPSYSFPVSGIPTKAECESLRSMISAIQAGYDGCKVSYRCTSCTGSDIATSQQMTPGIVAINGTASGQAFFLPNQAQSIQSWIDDVQQKIQVFGDNSMSNNSIPSTGNKEFDKAYQDEVVAYIGKSRSPIFIDPHQMTVKISETPSLPTFDADKRMKIAGVEHQMNLELEELNKIERLKESFCKTSPSDCEYYQKKWDEVNGRLEETKAELKGLKQNEYNTELDNYKQELEKYKQQQSEQNEFWGAQTQKQIDYLNEQIVRVTDKLNGIDTEIAEKENYIKEKNSQMSWADKTEEIANERLKKIGEQRDELHVKFKNKEISANEYRVMSDALSTQEKTAMADIVAAKTARTSTNAYEYVKENQDAIKSKTIDVVELAAHAGVIIIARGTAPETAGTSLLLEPIAHLEISILANMARGQDFGDATRGAVINKLQGMAIDKAIPVRIIAGGSKINVMHTNAKGEVVYQTTKKVGGKEISSSQIWDAASTGWGLSQ